MHLATTWKELTPKSLCLPISGPQVFQEYHRNREKKVRVYTVLGDVVTKLQTLV